MLDRIKSELDKGNGNDEGKNTFKAVVQGVLGGSIDNFVTQVTTTYGN